MTRKRFIKLAMARGMQRNDAQKWVTNVKSVGDYSSLYVLFLFQGQYFMSDLAQSIDGFFKAVSAATHSLSDFTYAAFGIDFARGTDMTGGGAE